MLPNRCVNKSVLRKRLWHSVNCWKTLRKSIILVFFSKRWCVCVCVIKNIKWKLVLRSIWFSKNIFINLRSSYLFYRQRKIISPPLVFAGYSYGDISVGSFHIVLEIHSEMQGWHVYYLLLSDSKKPTNHLNIL